MKNFEAIILGFVPAVGAFFGTVIFYWIYFKIKNKKNKKNDI